MERWATRRPDPLVRVRQELRSEFGGTAEEPWMDAIAREEVASYEDARIKEFVPILAWRSARRRVRATLAETTRPPGSSGPPR